MTIFALKFVNYRAVQDHLRAGWMVSIPNAPMHHHHYGIELAWLCACPVPGGFNDSTPTIEQETLVEREMERT